MKDTNKMGECPDCKSVVPSNAKKCKHCGSDLRSWFGRHPIITFILGFIIIGQILGIVLPETSSTPSVSQINSSQSFDQIAKAHFKQIQSGFSSSELKNIECFENNCDSSVVYFNFKTIPSDLDMIIRSNAVIFSNLKKQEKGTSSVTVTATLGDKILLKCNSKQGKTTDCK